MEIAAGIFFLAIFFGMGFLAIAIYIIWRRRKQG